MTFLALLLLLPGLACALAPMPTPRYGLGAAVVGGKLYAAGGAANAEPTGVLERYDPAKDAWTELAPMASPRSFFQLAAVGGKLYAIGGEQTGRFGGVRLDSVEVYDVASGRWSPGPRLPRPVSHGAAAVIDGVIYLAGGVGAVDSPVTDAVLALDTRTGAWTELPPMTEARADFGVAAAGERLWAVAGNKPSGGRNHLLSAVESYDPSRQTWRLEQGLPWAATLRAESVGGVLYAFGGSDGVKNDLDMMAYYDGAHWQPAPSMPTGRSSYGSASDGSRLFVLGGSPGHNLAYDTLEIYDAAAKTWRTSRGREAQPVAAAPAAYPAPARARPAPAPAALDELIPPAPLAKAREDDFALVIGLEDYRSVMAAQYGREDALAFARYATAKLGVPAENVITLTGDKATKTDIEKYVEEWLPRNVEKDSRVYVYYSGHGAPDPERGDSYLLPWDGDPEFLQTSGYPLSRFYEKLSALPARHVVVFLDSCFSGAGGRSVIAKNLRPLVQVAQTPAPKGRLTILSASGASQVAGGYDAKRHGLFTYYLLRGLGGEAARDGHVDVDALYGYVRQNVRKRAHRENRDQDPQLQTREPALRLY